MLLGRLKKFREKTMRIYEEDHRKEMEPWKLQVLKMHEEANFLFYFDEFLDWDEQTGKAMMKGNLVKGDLPIGSEIFLYTGDAELLSTARVESEPTEKEERRIGMVRDKKNVMEITLLPKMEWREMEAKFVRLQRELSLVTSYSPEKLTL